MSYSYHNLVPEATTKTSLSQQSTPLEILDRPKICVPRVPQPVYFYSAFGASYHQVNIRKEELEPLSAICLFIQSTTYKILSPEVFYLFYLVTTRIPLCLLKLSKNLRPDLEQRMYQNVWPLCQYCPISLTYSCLLCLSREIGYTFHTLQNDSLVENKNYETFL